MNTIKNRRVIGILAIVLAGPMVASLPGCTDLGEDTFGIVTPDQFYRTEEEILAALAPVYAQLRSTLGAYHNVSQVSSDESIVPTRGSDWYDNGVWLALHRQTWDETHPEVNGAWESAYTGIARANGLLQTLESPETSVPGKEAIVAELRVLRAFYYYQLMDLFGGVLIIGDEPGEYAIEDITNPPGRESRTAVFNFIESEVLAALPDLPTRSEVAYGRVTQGAAKALLANLYVNAAVYTGTVTEAGLQPGTARWQDALDMATELINDPDYSLAADWFSNFAPDNSNASEHIFVVAHLPESGLGLNFIHRALHYNQFTPEPWNGFATLAETYATFDDDDVRKNIFLSGPQVNVETGEPVNNRQGDPLVFTPIIGNIENAGEGEGVRIYKWPADPEHEGPDNGNDYAFFRLAEMYLIAADALNELGDTPGAIGRLNDLRARVFEPDEPLSTSLSQAEARDAIMRERLFELTYEAKRRQDLIRYGHFTDAWEFKTATQGYRVLFPIPQRQLDANPNLVQNCGYAGGQCPSS